MDAERTVNGPVEHRSHGRRWILVGVAVALLAALALVNGRRQKNAAAAQTAAAAASRTVPVSVVSAARRDVPIYVDGLGNVLPLATVTVKSQVDGRLDKVLFVEGQRVRKGEVLAQVDPRPFLIQLHQAQAAFARDDAQLRNTRLNLKRFQGLGAEKLIPQQQVDDQQAQVDQLSATTKTDQAQIETARLNLDYARITSPIDGVTGVRNVDPGNLIHASDANGIVVLTQLDPIAVLFTLPQDDLPRVAKAMSAGPLTVDAFSRDGSTKLASGTLLLVDNQVNVTTATVRLKALFPNPDQVLWPNQFVKARLLLTIRKGALVTPTPAIQHGPQGAFVYVVAADGTAVVKPVGIDATVGDLTLIGSGLSLGDRVVVDGQNQLRPGSKVQPRSADGGRTASATSEPADAP